MVSAKVSSFTAVAHHLLGDIPRAMENYRRALRAQVQVLHPSHPDLVSTELGIARAQRDLGNSEGALHAIEAVETTLRQGHQEGLDLSRALIYKSDMLRENKRTAAAEEAIKEAIDLQAALFQGEEHPEAAIALSSYGSILHDSGKADEAHDKYKRALWINLKTVGEKHPGTASAYNSLGTLYEDIGDDSTAHEHFSKCLKIQLDTLGEESPDVANTYNNLATVLFRQGQPAEAALFLRKALQVLDTAGVPQNSPDRLLYEENLEEIISSAKAVGSVAESAKIQGMEKQDVNGIPQDGPFREEYEDSFAEMVLLEQTAVTPS